jgi:hypothetical protein
VEEHQLRSDIHKDYEYVPELGSGLTASLGFDDKARPLRLWVTGPLARSLGPGLAED